MPQTLRAGPLSATFGEGALRHVRLGACEVTERIYGAVRDQNWSTPPGRIENLSVNELATSFHVVFDCVHQEGDLDFRWRGTIEGTAAGRIVFAMDGKAHSTFPRNRIGLCVHHPLRECAGRPCLIELVDGRLEQSEFPQFVAPHQPFRNMRAMAYEVGGVGVEVRFAGDVFETEDHRNWTDANFKTYGTPLSLPFPIEVTAGSEVHQRVEIALRGARSMAEPAPDAVVRVGTNGEPRPMPRIGLAMAANERPLSQTELSALRRLRLAHLRAECGPALERAAEEAQAFGAQLEIAVTAVDHLADAALWSPMTDRWLVFGKSLVRAVRQAVGQGAIVVVGTNAYFAELNRNRPDGDGWDGACFSVNPQVHMCDDESVMANAAAQYDAVQSAQRFLGGRGVIVSPVTLRPQFQSPDPRQKLQLCAAWTVASLKALAEAGAASVTYFETHGAGGLMDGGHLYPVYSVFEALAETFIPCAISDPARVAAMAFESGAGRRYLVANLTPNACEVVVDGSEQVLEPYAVVTVQGAG